MWRRNWTGGLAAGCEKEEPDEQQGGCRWDLKGCRTPGLVAGKGWGTGGAALGTAQTTGADEWVPETLWKGKGKC